MTPSSSPQKTSVEEGRRGSPKVLRFSIDINSSVPGSLWDGFVGIEVVRDERELVAVSEIKGCLLKSGETVEKDEVVDCRMDDFVIELEGSWGSLKRRTA
jgi:hypothetical protein